jgi:type IV pilus assembly protein PilC
MPSYSFVATDPSGATIKGSLDAPSAVRARNDLLGRHLRVVTFKQRKSLKEIELTTKKVKPQDLMIFSRQLAAFLKAGIPILDALEMLTTDAASKRLQQVLVEVTDALGAGSTFADAMAVHEKLFPSYYVGILRSAELSGNLDGVLAELAIYIERDVEASRAVKSALVYPAVIFVMSIGTVILLVSYVLPKFKKFFASFDAQLPLPTRMLLAVGDFFTKFGLVTFGLSVVLLISTVAYLRTEPGKQTRDRFLLKIPILHEVIRFAVVERFCRILSAMLQAGVPIPEAMTAALDATNNRVYSKSLATARDATMRGEGISRPIAETGLFPKAAEKMLLVGEESGTLDQQLDATAEYCAGERSYRLKRMTTMFEPLVIVLMGGMVGFVAIALVSAMYGIFNQVSVK